MFRKFLAGTSGSVSLRFQEVGDTAAIEGVEIITDGAFSDRAVERHPAQVGLDPPLGALLCLG